MNDTDVRKLINDWKVVQKTEDYDVFWYDYGEPDQVVNNLIEYLADLLEDKK